MNKKFLGLFFIVGLFTNTTQTANFGAALRANPLFAARGRGNEQNGDAQNPAIHRAAPPVAPRLRRHENDPQRRAAETAEARRLAAQNADRALEEELPPPPIEDNEPEIIFVDENAPQNVDTDDEGVEDVGNRNQPAGFAQRLFRWFGRTNNTAPARVVRTPNAINNEENPNIFNCSICLVDISANEDANSPLRLKQTACGHNFHAECIDACETCPNCRTELTAAAPATDNDEETTYTAEQIYKCPICLDPCLETDEGDHKVFATPCQHFFHTDCLQQACQAAAENWGPQACPSCRQPLNTVAAPIVRAVPTWQRNNAIDQEAEARQRRNEEEIRLLLEARNTAERERDAAREALENNAGTHLSATTAAGLAGAGAIATACIPGATKVVKNIATTVATKTYNLACEYPKETAAGATATGLTYVVLRGTTRQDVASGLSRANSFISRNTDKIIVGLGGLGLAKMIFDNR